jgi:hypothetical protein
MVDTSPLVEEKKMSRNLNNLRRLFSKLQLRYGDDDALVLQVKKELDAREAVVASHRQWSIPYRDFIKVAALNSAGSTARHVPVSTTMSR